jgi:hypothetical protein
MNLLNDCTDAQDVEKDVNRQRLAAGKLNTLHNATIQAMSNLLSANIDSGLMHSLGKRLCYMHSEYVLNESNLSSSLSVFRWAVLRIQQVGFIIL